MLAGQSFSYMAPAAKLADSKDESITNVQHAGVDEGGIVKRHGDHLVILRRGRLFTVRIGDNKLAPVSMANAYGRGIDPGGAWYDEMLISGGTIAVIGYSYYSSRNYASRLIGSKLVF